MLAYRAELRESRQLFAWKPRGVHAYNSPLFPAQSSPFAPRKERAFAERKSTSARESALKERVMVRRFTLLVVVALAASLAGCRTMWPRWFAPGNIQEQRYSATLHDPYPSAYAGPEVVGGRPREFQKPLAEPRASQLQQERLWRTYP
jgi:hypothetical protein